jgi:signal transduction histidine kinase
MQHSAKEPITCVSDRRRGQNPSEGNALIEAQEKELRLISQELHDDLGQRLALLQMQISQLEHKCESGDIVKGLRILRESVDEMDRDLHRICYRLYPAILDQLGLTVALEAFCREFSKFSGIRTTFINNENLPKHLARDVSLCLYRLVQEALNNVSKHSGAKWATVTLRGSMSALEVEVKDSGNGFDPDALQGKRGLGLTSMEQRVLRIGGRYDIRSRPGLGTAVKAVLPDRLYKMMEKELG